MHDITTEWYSRLEACATAMQNEDNGSGEEELDDAGCAEHGRNHPLDNHVPSQLRVDFAATEKVSNSP